MMKYTYTLTNNKQYTSNLKQDEFIKRYSRLDILRILVEGYDEGIGYAIYNKVNKALNKQDNFTGIIRLNSTEKSFLWYSVNDSCTNEEIEVFKHYLDSEEVERVLKDRKEV